MGRWSSPLALPKSWTTVGPEPIGMYVDKEVVMTDKREPYFEIAQGGCPGPFQITAGIVERLKDPWKEFVLDFTIFPANDAIEASIGHPRIFCAEFEVRFFGFVNQGEENNIRLLGKFKEPTYRNGNLLPFKTREKLRATGFFDKLWEVIFDTHCRTGEVFRLDQPLDLDGKKEEAARTAGASLANFSNGKEKTLMLVIERMIVWHQIVHANNVGEGIFRLFELAKRIHQAEDQKSLDEATKDLEKA